MRAREPDATGFASHDGVRVGYEVFGDDGPAVVLMPTWPIVHARMWKAQVPFLARRCRVVTFDPRGNGASDRPTTPEAYADAAYVGDALAVMDAVGIERAVVVGYCSGVRWTVELADAAPERVLGIVSIAAGVPHLTPPTDERQGSAAPDERPRPSSAWAAKMDRGSWRADFRGFIEAHSGPEFMTPEPFSAKLREDLIGWGLETTVEALLAMAGRPKTPPMPTDRAASEALLRRIRCPVLAIAGTEDRCQSVATSERLAEITGGQLAVLEGAGHAMFARHPVPVNLLIAEFVERVAGAPARPAVRRWTRALERPRRVLLVSSPIGLGHARRDLAIANALRTLRPDVSVEWLTQHPVTTFLEAHGERVHAASRLLANESAHIESEASNHELNVFEAIRRMDEILVANFMVFHDVVSQESFDLVIGDEAWDVDHFLFENPELKRVPFAWLTDFVGWLPLPEGGAIEAARATEMNAEMITHVERFPRVRDRAIFIGDPDDVVDAHFGPGLPAIRPWVEAHYDFAGYVSDFDAHSLGARDEVREALGYGAGELVCVVSVGGSGVGRGLIERAVAAFPLAKSLVPSLRMVVVTGPRIDPASFAPRDGLEIQGFVRDLHRHHAACDMAIVQGGLSTTMELTAAQRPFIFVPIRRHFEQNVHVRHRLARYGAGRCLPYDEATPEALAEGIATMIDRPVRYREVASDGAARVAGALAELL